MSSITDTLLGVPDDGSDAPFLLDWLSSPASAVAFWLAVAMPMAYVPLLISGLGDGHELGLFLGLLAIHIVALRAGRSHRSE